MKRWWWLVLAAMVALLAACGPKADKTAADPTAKASEDSSKTRSGKGVSSGGSQDVKPKGAID